MPRKYKPRATRPFADRFWEKVDKTGQCWLWKAACGPSGHGWFSRIPAHRVAWELTNGAIPDGLFVLHDCPDGDNPACVNPAHLWLGTQADNMRDMFSKGRGRGMFNGTMRGESCHAATLTEEQVRAIRARRAAGARLREIAAEFGISMSGAHSVASGKSWKHVA